MRRPSRRWPAGLAAAALVLALAACTSSRADERDREAAVTSLGGKTLVLPTPDPAAATLAVTATMWQAAPAVVVAAADDAAGLQAAAGVAEQQRWPVLVTGGRVAGTAAEGGTASPAPPTVESELQRLGTARVLAVGQAGATDGGFAAPKGVTVTRAENAADAGAAAEGMPAVSGPTAEAAPVVLVNGRTPEVATASARAAGGQVVPVRGNDPRGDVQAIDALSGDAQPVNGVVALGAGFGPPARLAQHVAVAATGAQLPGGGQLIFPYRRMVALYGHPGAPVLGVLGEQGPTASVARVQKLVDRYQPYSDLPVVPGFEIIATVASASAGSDGNYSAEASVDELLPYVEAAEKAGVYVVLDLQPGRTDFLTQARLYESLLTRPTVGLALDPEWRLKPNQVHLQQIGSVRVEEVNQVAAWLAQLTRENRLPQKMLLLHQFQTSMIQDRERLTTTYDELAYVVQMDGQGGQPAKQSTWATIKANAPKRIWFGWKNFYDEDQPMLTPRQTMRDVTPTPWWVSYQ